MASNGRHLESLVAYIESRLLPASGFEVTTNEKVYENGVQVAEFDIQIRGTIGSASMSWLIECRDRKSDGPAGVDWIEQLVGRRSRFGFNIVTAVSTGRSPRLGANCGIDKKMASGAALSGGLGPR